MLIANLILSIDLVLQRQINYLAYWSTRKILSRSKNLFTSHMYEVSVAAVTWLGLIILPWYGPIQVPSGITCLVRIPNWEPVVDGQRSSSSGQEDFANVSFSPFFFFVVILEDDTEPK